MKTLLILFFSYCSLLLAWLLIPEKIWDKLLEYCTNVIYIFRQNKKKWPYIGVIYCGEELVSALSECEARITLGIKIIGNFLPRYKFYTSLLEQLLSMHRTQGIGIKKFIPEIRLALIRDLQFEKKILDEIISAFLQFLVITATTWSFVFLSKSLVQIPLDKTITIVMISLELIGSLIFNKLISVLKNKVFAPFSKAIEELYLFSSLLAVGMSINEVLKTSGIMQGSFAAHKNFKNFDSRFKKLILRMKETGLSPIEETQEIIREIWHLQEVYFLKFTKMVQLLKFVILAFFFLPAYFLYLYSIFKFFMEQ